MRRFLPFLSTLVLVIPFLINVPVASAHTTIYDPNPYGVTIESKEAGIQTDASSADMNHVGDKWVRQQMHEDKEQTSPGVWDWSLADSEMAMSMKYGLKVDWALQAPPTWEIQPGCQQVPQAQPFANYAVMVYQRYGAEISSFEVGNEEWSFDKTLSCRTPQNYVSVLMPVISALRNAGYTGLIGMYGYTNYSSVQQITDWFTGFNSDPSNPGNQIDYYNFHFYNNGRDPNLAYTDKPSFPSVYQTIHNVALQYNHGHKPTWVTEFGWNTNCNQTPNCNLVTTDQQSQYYQEVYDDGRTSGGVLDHAFNYTLCDPCQQEKSIYQAGVPLPAANMEAAYSVQYPTWPQL